MFRNFLLAGLLAFIIGCNVKQQQPEKMISIDRESFSLEYPSSWKIDTKDEDYDPDAMFSINAPDEGSMIMFVILDMEMDAAEMIEEHVKNMTESAIKKPTAVTAFSSWGHYKGVGKTIKGKLMGLFKGQVHLFVTTQNERTLFIMEQYHDEDADVVRPLLDKIAASFKLKK